jgi:hypothetical protein
VTVSGGVRLDRPAVLATVQIAGRLVTLSPPTDPGDDLWLGYLDNAGLRHGPLDLHLPRGSSLWVGNPAVCPRVRVTAFFADGRAGSMTATVSLHPGFG